MNPNSEHNACLRKLQNIINEYTSSYHDAIPVAARYKTWYDCQNHARQELSGKLPLSEINGLIARNFGITPQTLYRSRMAMRSYSKGGLPPKYARASYNKIIKTMNTEEIAKNNIDYHAYVSDVLPDLFPGLEIKITEASLQEGSYRIRATVGELELTAESARGVDAITAIRANYDALKKEPEQVI